MTVFTCDDNYESILTCIYDAWASRLGHGNVRLQKGPVLQPDLFSDYIHIEADPIKAEKVQNSIIHKISAEAYDWIFYTTLSAEADAPDAIYRFLILGFQHGGKVTSMLTHPEVLRVMELQRRVGNEAHSFREFIRFAGIKGAAYVSHIEPKNNCLIPLAWHFSDRMPSENWIIVDDGRRTAVVHPKDEDFYIQYLTDEEWETLSKTEEIRDGYTELWCEFFDAIGIKERENYACQRNMFPLWMRKHAVEFMREKAAQK